ncbi:MAG TPA: hypothetical protein VNC50_02550, partial [Planctomycetia bacterium]|nr:hypothetical protein [Planctomycetia bacterium]
MTAPAPASVLPLAAPPRVVSLEAFVVRIPLKTTIRHASHSRDSSDNLVVRATLDDGSVGYGEGVPRDYVTGETVAVGVDLLRRTNWADQLPLPENFAAAVRALRDLELPAVPGDERGCVGNAARCAAELALLDAFGKSFGEPVSAAVALPEYA